MLLCVPQYAFAGDDLISIDCGNRTGLSHYLAKDSAESSIVFDNFGPVRFVVSKDGVADILSGDVENGFKSKKSASNRITRSDRAGYVVFRIEFEGGDYEEFTLFKDGNKILMVQLMNYLDFFAPRVSILTASCE